MIFNVFVSYLFMIALFSIKNKVSVKLFYLNSLLLILFIGLRSYEVGGIDTHRYVRFFIGKSSFFSTVDDREIESGFIIYNNILRFFFSSGWQYLLFNAVFSILPLLILVRRYSSNVHFSLLLFFIGLGPIHSVYFICTRQIIGTSFVLWGMIAVLNKKRFYRYIFILLSVIGTMIHSTVPMLSLAFILLYHTNIKRKVYIILALVSFIIGYIGVFENFQILQGLFFISRLSTYVESTFVERSYFLYPFTRTIIGIIICFVVNDKLYNDIFAKILLVGIILGNLFPSFAEIYRLTGLFTIFGLISSTYIYTAITSTKFGKMKSYLIIKNIPKHYVVLTVFIALFYSYYKFAESNTLLETRAGREDDTTKLVPYKFFWEEKFSY